MLVPGCRYCPKCFRAYQQTPKRRAYDRAYKSRAYHIAYSRDWHHARKLDLTVAEYRSRLARRS